MLGREGPHGYDVVEFPSLAKPARPAVFLHGGAGNYVMECWLVASILRESGYDTLCPTYDFVGWWPKPEGEAIFRDLLRYVRGRYGGERVLLAGLSNGVHGALAFSGRFASDVRGVILLSGGVPRYPQGKVPGLIVWGRQDERIPVALGREIFARNRERDEIFELDGDHFVLLGQHAAIARRIRDWLRALDAGSKK